MKEPHETDQGPEPGTVRTQESLPIDASSPATLARRIIRFRRRRETLFGAALFADPAWDMLLDLMIAEEEGRPVSVNSLCIAAAMPATTTLRWIAALAELGFIHRRPHPQDQRATLVSLTAEASSQLRRLLAEW